jgi:hypothetical protein
MGARRAANPLLFCLAAGLLLLAAFAFSHDGGRQEVPTAKSGPARLIDPQPLRPPGAAQGSLSHLHSVARHFLAAFLRYEVGDLSAAVRRGLRSRASHRFSAELLARPPHGLRASPPSARISRLRVALLSRAPGRALISGSARRGGRLEQFSFLFEARRGAWRCVGPGE